MAGNRFLSYIRFISRLSPYLKNPVSLDQAKKEIENRLRNRNDNFLKLAKQAIYANHRSPYNYLLKMAGCPQYIDMMIE